jgi:acyl-CoA synthetase (AMP-forming)/AMP-acid ligase II
VKNLIIRAGRNSPLEIERYASMVTGVLDAAAVGIDVGSFGEDTHVICEIGKRIRARTKRDTPQRD